jgi:hypothetical protein
MSFAPRVAVSVLIAVANASPAVLGQPVPQAAPPAD